MISLVAAASWLSYGGLMLIPIAMASLLGVGLMIGKWIGLRSPRVVPESVKIQVLRALDQKEWARAEAITTSDISPLSKVYREGLRFRGASRSEIREAMEEAGRREVALLERFIGAVGALASVTPLMGLLGTVLGMIKVFQVVVDEAAQSGMADPTLLAGGIWEALVTTAAGLAVAIPLYLGYRALLGSVDSLSLQLEEASKLLLDRLAPPPAAAVAEGLPQEGRQSAKSEGAQLVVEGA